MRSWESAGKASSPSGQTMLSEGNDATERKVGVMLPSEVVLRNEKSPVSTNYCKIPLNTCILPQKKKRQNMKLLQY